MLRRLFGLIVLVTLLGGAWYVWRERALAGLGGEPGAGEKLGALGDELRGAGTQVAVKTAFSLDRRLSAYDIGVDASDGVVTLRGEVGTEDARRQAVEVASAVPNVRSVIDHLRVEPSRAPVPDQGRTLGETLDDRALEGKIRLMFSLNRGLDGTDLIVRAYRRAVTLQGEVASAEQHQLALRVASDVPGAGPVSDEIRESAGAPGVAPASPASPSTSRGAAAQRATGALAANGNLAPYGLRVSDQGGRLAVSGRVRTGAEKDLAGALAREASGSPVDNVIEVRPE